MLDCTECNGQYRFDEKYGFFHCPDCGSKVSDPEEIRKLTSQLYNDHYFGSILLSEGEISFFSKRKLEDNPYSEDFAIMWEEGWKSAQEKHNQFTEVQELREKIKIAIENHEELKELISKKDTITLDVIKKINNKLSPYYGKFFRFGQNAIVDELVYEIEGIVSEFIGNNNNPEEKEDSWIPIEQVPKLGAEKQSDYVFVTDGEEIVQAYYYDFTSEKDPKPNQATGKGWHCHGIRKTELTHWKPRIFPKKEKKNLPA